MFCGNDLTKKNLAYYFRGTVLCLSQANNLNIWDINKNIIFKSRDESYFRFLNTNDLFTKRV